MESPGSEHLHSAVVHVLIVICILFSPFFKRQCLLIGNVTITVLTFSSCTVTGSPYQGRLLMHQTVPWLIVDVCSEQEMGRVMAHMLAFVINGLKTGLLFLAVPVNPNPQTRQGHSPTSRQTQVEQKEPQPISQARETQNMGSVPS